MRHARPLALIALVLACLAAPHSSRASRGDRAPAYRRCVSQCLDTLCSTDTRAQVHDGDGAAGKGTTTRWEEEGRTLALRLTRWTCDAECSYQCAQSLTELSLELGTDSSLSAAQRTALTARGRGGALDGLRLGHVEQFHGKWPFVRLLGMQEPVSVLASLINLGTHARGISSLFRSRLSDSVATQTLRRAYMIAGLVACNAWVWSAVFHTRDTRLTESLDYFSASASTLAGLYLALIRTFSLYINASVHAKGTALLRKTIVAALSTAFIAHCSYLSLASRFDYGYNMQANMMCALAQVALWLICSLRGALIGTTFAPSTPIAGARRKQRDWRAMHAVPALLLLLCAALELGDFPPWPVHSWRLVDAHALWHFATVPVAMIWYDALRRDLKFVEARSEAKALDRANGKRES